MKVSTNALTARYCKLRGWPCQTVQTFYGGRRHDLFGIADTIVFHPGGELWIQNASYGTLKAHRDAIGANEHISYIDRHGLSVLIWEWRRKKVGRKKLWFKRGQMRSSGIWNSVGDWEGPLDL